MLILYLNFNLSNQKKICIIRGVFFLYFTHYVDICGQLKTYTSINTYNKGYSKMTPSKSLFRVANEHIKF